MILADLLLILLSFTDFFSIILVLLKPSSFLIVIISFNRESSNPDVILFDCVRIFNDYGSLADVDLLEKSFLEVTNVAISF